MKTIELSPRAYIRIDRNGSHSVHKDYAKRGELYATFRSGNAEDLSRALRYVGATKAEINAALKQF